MPCSSRSPAQSNPAARVQLLSNGSYAAMINANGSGYSCWRDFAVTRWREDPVGDGWGNYLLLRDESSGEVWSSAPQPIGAVFADDKTEMAEGRVAITRRYDDLESRLQVAVDADHDVELRRLTLTNHGDVARDISLTSYAELVLGPASADAAHPAFSKMFVQTAWIADGGILLATRRRRSPDEPEVWAAHVAVVDGQDEDTVEFETDRMRFLGRGNTLRRAHAMRPDMRLSCSSGCVLDPVFSLRRRVHIAPGASVRVDFFTAVADARPDVLDLAQSLREDGAGDRLVAAPQERPGSGGPPPDIDADQAARFNALAGAILYADARLRASGDELARGSGGPPVLWGCGISGDRPIVLMRVAATDHLPRVNELLSAQRYWQSKRLAADVVLLDAADDDEHLLEQMQVRAEAQNSQLDGDDGAVEARAFVLRETDLPHEVREGLMTAARIAWDAADAWPDMEEVSSVHGEAAQVAPVAAPDTSGGPSPGTPGEGEFDNGMGGFVESGRAYAITLANGRCTPQPWINVIANMDFGFLVSAEGGGYAWSINSQQNPLTPWPNDAVSDTPHDVLYLRDADSGAVWSATAEPMRVPRVRYTARHEKGSSSFGHTAHEINVELLQFVPRHGSVKISRLRLHNRSPGKRRLEITGYVEWALAPNGKTSGPYVLTERDDATGALFARNRWREDFAERVAFVDLGGRQTSCTGDRLGFLGRLGSVAWPAAPIEGGDLSGRVGAGLHPCGALRTLVELEPGACVDILMLLGDAADASQARALIETYRSADLDRVLDAAREPWDSMLDTVQVHTPDRAMDIVLNDWLLYQTLGCRVWARTAYYQASGAYGFRDQLQDVLALCVARPDIAREHLLRAAGRQFPPGDVQHWWLPPSGKGIRTRIKDDRIWLAYAAAYYVTTTGDTAVLDENVPFLEGDAIEDGKADAFFQPQTSEETVSLYEHAARAIDSSLTRGAHGLPLIGHGDWNDGMNNVGAEGHGESVWLAWLLLAAIRAWIPFAGARNEQERIDTWRTYADELEKVLDGPSGWDGEWYRRGYYDDGTPLGSSGSEACRIAQIAQSWSLISGAGDADHARQAMAAVETYLIRHDDKVALLFTPPFDKTSMNPGYIKGYPPGVRENGGQYTHGAIWSVFGHAKLGQGDEAKALFDILNPIRHGDTAQAMERYQVEPYVTCADVYSVEPYIGRGGWTWYTGSAGWLYRAGLEAILGFRRQGDRLLIEPCIPASWPGYAITYRHRGDGDAVTCYEIAVENPHGVQHGVILIALDEVAQVDAAAGIALLGDGQTHQVRVVMGAAG